MGGRSGSFRAKKSGGGRPSLPELQGSEKQTKWANEIRQKWLNKIDKFEKNGEVEDYNEDRDGLIHLAQYGNMGESGSLDADFPEFASGGVYKSSLKESYDDAMSGFVPSEREVQNRVRDYYKTVMSTYNKYAPKGKVPDDNKAYDKYTDQESRAYRKTLVQMARRSVNKVADASDYINHYRL